MNALMLEKAFPTHRSPYGDGAVWRVRLAGGMRTGLLLMKEPDEGWIAVYDMDYMNYMPTPEKIISRLGESHAFATRRDLLTSIEGVLLEIGLLV